MVLIRWFLIFFIYFRGFHAHAGFPPPVYAPGSATSNGIVKFLGSSPRNVTSIGPATSGYVMTSSGTDWYAAALPSGSVSYVEIFHVNGTALQATSGYVHFVCPVALTFTAAKLLVFERNGIATGSLTVDVSRGPTPSTMTSMFSTKPTLAFGSVSDFASNSGIQNTTSCYAGEVLRFDVSSVPPSWYGTFNFYLYGTP